MKRTPSDKPAVKLTLALFISLLTHPGLGWNPKTRGWFAPAAELTGVVFAAVAPAYGGRGHGNFFVGGLFQ